MTASRRGLAILTAIAVALAAVHVLAGGRAEPIASRTPFADLDPAAISLLQWDRPDAPAVAVRRDGGGWMMTTPSPGPADPAVIADVIDTLRTARWQRRAAAAPGPVRATLTLAAPGRTAVVVAIGSALAGAGAWVSDGRAAYLLEPWVVGALDRDALDLRQRALVTTPPGRITGVEFHGDGLDLVLVGTPLAIADRGQIRLAPAVAAALTEGLAGLRVESLIEAAPAAAAPRLAIRVLGGAAPEVIEVRGPCPDRPDRSWIAGTAGEACVPAAAVAMVETAARLIAAVPLEVADRRPVAGAITEITLASGVRLTWRGASVEAVAVDGAARPADDDAVARVVAALTEPAPIELLAEPRRAAVGAIGVTTTTGAERLELLPGGIVTRATSRVGHRVSPAATAALWLPFDAVRDRTLWRSEPSLLTALVVADAVPTSVPVDDPRARALAEALARPRAVRFLPAPPATRRTFQLTYAPPPMAGAAPEVHRLELGAELGDGCAAVADGEAVVLLPALCRLLRRGW